MRRVLITRSRSQSEAFAVGLRAAGFEPVFFPVIEISPLEDNQVLASALQKINRYDWLVLTSTNSVELLWNRRDFPVLPETLRVAAVGPKTAAALRTKGVEPIFVPSEYIGDAILPGLGDLRGRLVLLPCAELARKDLPQAISEAGGVAHEITIYRTLPVAPDPQGLAALQAGVSVVTFTSPSTVQNFMTITRNAGLDPLNLPGQPKYACIGPVTANAAQEAGITGLLVAKEYTTEGLIEAIQFISVR